MKKVKVLDSLYEELCSGMVVQTGIKTKSFETYDKIIDLFKKYVKSDKAIEELEKRLDEFIFSQDNEAEYERRKIFKIGYNACNTLKVELGELKVIIDSNDISLDNSFGLTFVCSRK